MKRLLLVFALFLAWQNVHASGYEKILGELASELAHLIEKRGFEKVAIWNFQPIDSNDIFISKPLTEDFSVSFTNSTTSLKIYDRQNFDQIFNELKLQQGGLMDPGTAKKIGSFTGVEALVIGNFAYHRNKVKLWVKVLETESAFQIAMKNALLPWDNKIYKRTIADRRSQVKKRAPEPKAKMRPAKTGRLKFVNKKGSRMFAILRKGDFEKRVVIGGKSTIDIPNLEVGIYQCTIGFMGSKEVFEEHELKIQKDRTTRKLIRAPKLGLWWLY